MNLKRKKILFLGGAVQCQKAVEQANKMGVYTIVTDINPDAPAKAIANESLPFSVTDVENIIAWCKENPVDGVLNFCIDLAQKPNYYICTELGLPCFGTVEQIEYLSNKQAFKSLCLECGVDVIETYHEEDITDDFKEYPLLIKPAQSSGSRGSSVCYNKSEVEEGIRRAKQASTNGLVIIEKCMEGYQDFTAEYYFVDGNAYLVKAGDRYVGKKEDKLDRQASASVNPSKYVDMFTMNVNTRIIRMLKKIGIQNGALFMQGFVDGETVRFYDPAYRFPGSEYENSLLAATGLNLMEYAIRFALGEPKPPGEEFDQAYLLKGKCAISLFIAARPGTIAVYSGLEEIKEIPGVITVAPKAKVGSVIPDSGDVKQRVAEIGLLVDDDKQLIEENVLRIQTMLHVLDENGENMLVTQVDPRQFRI